MPIWSFQRAHGRLKYQLRWLISAPENIFLLVISGSGLIKFAVEIYQEVSLSVFVGSTVVLVAFFAGVLGRPVGNVDTELDLKPYIADIPNGTQNAQIKRACEYFSGAAIDVNDGQLATEMDNFSGVFISSREGDSIGFADYYCFNSREFERYLSKHYTVEEMFSSKYLKDPEARSAEILYISTVYRFAFITDQSRHAQLDLKVIIWSLARLILTMQDFPEGGLQIYSYGFQAGDKNRGNRLLRAHNFKISDHCDPSGNKLWVLENVTRQDLEDILDRYAEVERLCDFRARRSQTA